jgi:hypothetical protein
MDKIFRIFENIINAIMIVIGVVSVIGGFVTGMWHCFLLGAMSFSIPYAIWNERR